MITKVDQFDSDEEIFSRLLEAHGWAVSDSPVIPRRQERATARASFAQQRLWFLDQLDPGTAVYIIPLALRLTGPLNVPALQSSLNEIVRRHESLRTTFEMVDGQLMQRIAEPSGFALPVIDLRNLTAREETAGRLLKKEAQQPFDLATGPLVRASLLRLGEQDHILLLVMHHIISDGWSSGVLNGELSSLYRVYARSETPAQKELPIQYADYAEWQRDWLQGQVLERQLEYWKDRLAGSLPALDLAIDRPRPPVQTTRGSLYSFDLNPAVVDGLRQLCRQERATLFMGLLAAFQVLLSRYTGQTDIVVGTPVANRTRPEIEALIGFFVNTLVLRVDLGGSPTFRQVLQRVRDAALGAFEHQDIPFERLVEVLHPERRANRASLFQVMFAWENDERLVLDSLNVERIPIQTDTAKFELTLSCAETAGELSTQFEYNADLFDEATIARMAGHLQVLLAGIIAGPGERIARLPLLTKREHHEMLVEWNDTAAYYPQDRCIHELIQEQVERTPEAIALELEGATLTYRELNERANRLAHRLQRMGAGPDVLVGLCVDRSFDLIIGLLGILKAGAAYLPLDPRYPQERLAYMLGDARAHVLVTLHSLRDLLGAYRGQVIELDTEQAGLAAEPQDNPVSNVRPQNLAYIIYTSGSTGRPKGVMVQHGGLVNVAFRKQDLYKIRPGQRVIQFSSICFDASASDLLLALPVGAQLCLIRYQDEFSQIAQLGIQAGIFPPSALDILDPAACCLELVVSAGERCETRHLKRWLDGRRFINAYGPTEASIWTSAFEVQDATSSPPIGKPIGNTELYVLDRDLQPVPVGVAGELYIGGVGVSRGYINQPALTAERFVPDPFKHAGGRLYRTGDLARWRADGNLEFLGRIDQQVKVRGFRIELGEVEAVLQEHATVSSSLVLVREDLPGDKRLVAYLVTREGSVPSSGDLRTFLRSKLPDYMLPSAYVFLNAFPLNPNGKIDRAALPAPDQDRQDLRQGFVAPRDEVERVLAGVWANVLGVKQVGIHDDFFDLGGHSLLAAQLILKIRETFKINLPLRSLFQTSTIAEQARLILTVWGVPAEMITRGPDHLDLEAEAALDPAILPQSRTLQPVSPARILLTGATGFVGAFIARELVQQTNADVYCLVRAQDVEDGRRRIEQHLAALELWQPEWAPRIIPIVGDLAEPRLGLNEELFQTLSEQIDAVYHSGALVNFSLPYSRVRAANVLGTQEILRLASCRSVPVHHISTLSVLNSPGYEGDSPIWEAGELRPGTELQGGYAQSKWVAERLVMAARERGLPVGIYRLGMVAGDSMTGAWGLDDYLPRFIKGCIELGSIAGQDKDWNLIPADYAARALVEISLHPTSRGKVFHLFAPHSIQQRDLAHWLDALGYDLRLLPLPQWLTELVSQATGSSDQALYPLLSVLHEDESISLELQYDDRNVRDELANTGPVCPPIDIELFARYIGYFVRRGFIPGRAPVRINSA